MKRFALPLVVILLLAGCVNNLRDDDPSLGAAPDQNPLFAQSAAIGLINLWRVTDAAGEADETWLRLDASEFQLWRDCGMITGSWRATDSLLLASVFGASGDCATDSMPTVDWLESVTAFTQTPGGYELVGKDGERLASLTIDGAPEPIDTAAEFYTKPPELTEEVHALFREPAQLPGELAAATSDALQGKWIAAGTSYSTDPHVVFSADGTWTGSDGCNGGSGRWAAGPSGGFLATSAPSTLMYCEGALVPSWVGLAASAGLNDDNELFLFDSAGVELGALSG